jgi:hypothetical protein
MPEELQVDPTQAVVQEAELAAENMASGKEKTPQLDVEADYEASKEYSVSDVDKSGAGTQAAEAATTSKFEVPQAEETELKAEPTDNPDDYRELAREVNPRL